MNKDLYRKLGELIPKLGGDVVGHLFARSIFQEGDPEKGLRKELARQLMPHYEQSLADEAVFNRVKLKINPAEAKAVEQFLGRRGKHQVAHFILALAEMTVAQSEAERSRNEDLVAELLRRIARAPNDATKLKICVSGRLMREKETDYLAGWLEKEARQLKAKITSMGTTGTQTGTRQPASAQMAQNFQNTGAPGAAKRFADWAQRWKNNAPQPQRPTQTATATGQPTTATTGTGGQP